jgi:hypothetical protein
VYAEAAKARVSHSRFERLGVEPDDADFAELPGEEVAEGAGGFARFEGVSEEGFGGGGGGAEAVDGVGGDDEEGGVDGADGEGGSDFAPAL